MNDEERCCGSGTCIIDAQGICWCGQQRDGEKMALPGPFNTPTSAPDALQARPDKANDSSNDIP